MTKVVLYLRVSSPEQHANIQKFQCIEYINKYNYELIDIIEEKHTAYKNNENRVLFKFIQNIQPNQFDKLIIYSYDRFSRNVIDGIEMMQVLEKNNIALESVNDNIDYSTPQGRKLVVERFALSQYESDLISHRVKSANNYKRCFGLYIGNVPFGKKLEPIQRKKLINDNEEQKVINFIKCAKQGGYTSEELTNIIKSMTDIKEDDIVGSFDHKNRLIDPSEPMSNCDIASILNDFNIKKRKRMWTPGSVSYELKKYRH